MLQRLLVTSFLLMAGSVYAGSAGPTQGVDLHCLDLPVENISYGDIDKPAWQSWTGLELKSSLKNTRHLSIDASRDGHPHLVQRLIPTDKGSHRVVNRSVVPSSSTYYLTQSVYLEPGFEWGGVKEGGKLGFGLGGGSYPSGGKTYKDGFTARFMWRGNGDGTAHIAVYSYAADRSQNLPYGDDYPLKKFAVPVGEWFDLSMEVTLNSAIGKSDGSVRAWADGKLALERRNIKWQSAGGKPVIEFLSYATFYGGSAPTWSPSQTTYARFKNVCWAPIDGNGNDDPDPDPDPDVDAQDNRELLAKARLQIARLLPVDNGRIHWRLNKAVALLADAIEPLNWQSNALPEFDANVVGNVRRAAKKMLSAGKTRGATRSQRKVVDDVTRLIAGVVTNISTVAIEELNRLLKSADCTTSQNNSCNSAQGSLRHAQNELQQLRDSDDAVTILYHAEKIWKQVGKGIARLN